MALILSLIVLFTCLLSCAAAFVVWRSGRACDRVFNDCSTRYERAQLAHANAVNTVIITTRGAPNALNYLPVNIDKPLDILGMALMSLAGLEHPSQADAWFMARANTVRS